MRGAASEEGSRAPRRLATRAALAVATVGLLWVAFHHRLNAPDVRAWLQARLEAAVGERAGDARVGPASVDWFGRVVFGPLVIPASHRHLPPVAFADRVAVRPRWLALLRGRVEPASVTFERLRIEAGPSGAELRAFIERAPARRGGSRGGARPELRFPDVTVVFSTASGRAMTVGPLRGRLERGDGLFAEAFLPGGGELRADVWRTSRGAGVRARLEGVTAADLPSEVREALPVVIRGGALRVDVAADDEPTLERATARLSVEVEGLTVEGERLATAPVGPARLALEGRLRWDLPARTAALEDAQLEWGGGSARVALDARVALRPEPTFAVKAWAERLDYGAAIDGLPAALAPGPESPRLHGWIGARLEVAGPLRRPAEWALAAGLDLSGLAPSARESGPVFLRGPFRYRPEAGDRPAREIEVGPANPLFVPVSALPAHVVRAVTTSEDAGFFAHHGFDFDEMKNALAEGVGSGRLRGASTITQQLAKNLFLSRERTLARKVREALLTVALEAALPKARLIEIYLNIAEWGPGIYGIGEAARHYFAKDARDLTPKEAAFLATIIPNPVRYHVYFSRGELSETWEERVRALLQKLRDAQVLTDTELEEALAAPIVFARG